MHAYIDYIHTYKELDIDAKTEAGCMCLLPFAKWSALSDARFLLSVEATTLLPISSTTFPLEASSSFLVSVGLLSDVIRVIC